MAISVNRVTLIGRVGADPETKGREGQIVTFNLATSKSWKDKDSGEWRDATQWHKIVVFNKAAASYAEKNVRRGDLVYIEGAVETRKYDRNGEDVYVTEIVVHPFEGVLQKHTDARDRAAPEPAREQRRAEPAPQQEQSNNFSRDIDDDIPF